MTDYTVCVNIGFATTVPAYSPRQAEDYIRDIMTDEQFNKMVIDAMYGRNCEIKIEVVEE